MYLSKLNEKEQEYFLELAYYVSNYNDKFADEQKLLINQYRDEMLLFEENYQIEKLDLEEILNVFKESSEENKNAIFLEIMSLILSDNVYDKKEKEVISIIEEELNIPSENHDLAVDWVKDMQDLYSRADSFING
jgi:hypothetical protein